MFSITCVIQNYQVNKARQWFEVFSFLVDLGTALILGLDLFCCGGTQYALLCACYFFVCCQAQPQLKLYLSWAEFSINFSFHTHPPTHQPTAGIVVNGVHLKGDHLKLDSIVLIIWTLC